MRYGWITIVVSVCRDFNDDRSMDVIDFDNPVRTICNLLDDRGMAIIEIEPLLGRISDLDNYTKLVVVNGEPKSRTCQVVKKYYLKLPRPMTKTEARKYIEKLTGVKLPVEDDKKRREFLAKLYKELSRVN
ncbi:MAG: hypothetical protein GXO43_09875 [Crenarchaeota archaeon]|nr:hypothetical protein [Thermoproteota archaeon]